MVVLSWILDASFYGSVLIMLVLALKALAGQWMTSRWHYAIWLLVFARLALPAGPETRFSMGNLWQPAGRAVATAHQSDKVFQGFLAIGDDADHRLEPTVAKGSGADNLTKWRVQDMVLLAWGAGAIVMLVALFMQGLRVRRLIRNAKPVIDEATAALLRKSCSLLQIRREVRLLCSDDISYPALAGVTRPVVLIPSSTLGSVSHGELEFILIHELVHLRRMDLLFAVVSTLLLTLHWFNPLVWFAWFRMRQDREIACDAAVVRIMGSDVAADYGRTLLKLAEQIGPQRGVMSGAVGIMEGKSETGKRIVMLSNYRKSGRARSWTGALVTLMLVAVGFTSAQVETPEATDSPVSSLTIEMPEIQEIPADLKKRLAAQNQFLKTIGPVTTTSTWPLPMPPVPRGKLFEEQTPFMITVDEKDGKLVYTYSPEPKKLLSMIAEKTVVFSTSETTITAEKLKYTVADEILSAEGPGLSVSVSNQVYKADRLEWDIKNSSMKLIGEVEITDKSQGNVSKTFGDRITISTRQGTAGAPLPAND